MGTESDGGLATTDEQKQETPPATQEGHGEHEAGATQQQDENEGKKASSGDDPEARDDDPHGVKKRVNRANRDRDVARGQAAEAAARAEQAEAELARVRSKYEPDAVATERQPARHEPASPQATQQWNTRVEDFIEDGMDVHEDFDEVVRDNPRMRMTPTMAEAVMDADNGVEIAYHLGKNPREARRIASLSPTQQAKEIGKLEASLGSKSPVSAVTKKPSKTPAPIDPVGKGKTASTKADDSWSVADFARQEAESRKTGSRRI